MATHTDKNLANDNGAGAHPKLDARASFHNLLDKLRADINWNKADTPLSQNEDKAEDDEVSQERRPFKYRAQSIIKGATYALLFILLGFSAWLLTSSTDPFAHVTAFGGLLISGLAAASMANAHQRWRLKALSVLFALFSGFAALFTLGAFFDVTWLNITENGFWFALSLLSLWASYAFKSRIALYMSLVITALWVYMLLSGSIELSSGVFWLPLTAAFQTLVAKLNQDKFGLAIAGSMILGWSIALTVFAQRTGVVTFPFIMSLLLIAAGVIYTATAHPIKVWYKDKSRTTGLIAWAALMMSAIATSWMWLYATLDVSDAPTALSNFLWQLALIAGIGILFASIFIRRRKTAHKLSRRLFRAFAVMGLALTHYFQHDILAILQQKDLETLPYFAAIAMLGAITTLTLSRFLSSMTYEHRSGMVVSLAVACAIGASMSILVTISQSALWLFLGAAILMLWCLAMTQNNISSIKTANQNRKRLPLLNKKAIASRPSPKLKPQPLTDTSILKEA